MPTPAIPGNLLDSRVISNTVGAADAVLAASKLTVYAADPLVMNWQDLVPGGFVHTAYAAGTNQITTIDTTAATVTVGVTQTMTIKFLLNNNTQTVSVVPATTNVSTLKTSFINAFNAAVSSTLAVMASTGANTATITEQGLSGAFLITFSDTGITVVTGTPHVDSNGTYAEVVQYNANALVGGQFDKYQFPAKKLIAEGGGQANNYRVGQYIVWAEKNDAQFAAFNSALVAFMDGSSIVSAATTQPYLENV